MVTIDRTEHKVLISFDAAKVSVAHAAWLESVKQRIGLGQLDPQPYWGFDDLTHKVGTKLLNCFYVQAEVKREGDREYYRYVKAMMLKKFSFEGFIKGLESAIIFVDIDARTGHNHGTKFRIKQHYLPTLYEEATVVMDTASEELAA